MGGSGADDGVILVAVSAQAAPSRTETQALWVKTATPPSPESQTEESAEAVSQCS